MKAYEDLFSNSGSHDGSNNNILFKELNPTAPFTKPGFANHLNQLSETQEGREQLKKLKELFDFCKAEGKLSREPQHKIENGEIVTWLILSVGRVRKPIRIIHFEDIKQLIDDYAAGTIKITQTLEELYNEALS